MTDSSYLSWKEYWGERIERSLLEKFRTLKNHQEKDIERLLVSMEHTLESGGKRLRPLLCLAAANAIGGKEELALPGAISVELIHTYSLIHDDLPALDNDPVRRGRPSCHLAFGEATAILAGDALQSLAFETLADAADIEPKNALLAIRILSKAIGPLGMVGGQIMDLAFEKRVPKLTEQKLMAKKKTGELIAASLAIGGALCGASDTNLYIFHKAGSFIGEAFQIQDDLLNYEGDPQLLGKAVGTDATRGKASILNYMDPISAKDLALSLVSKGVELVSSLYSSKMLQGLFNSLIDRKS